MDDQERRERFDREVLRVIEERGKGAPRVPDAIEGGYGKWRLRVRGEKVVSILFTAACLGFVSYLVWRHDVESKVALAAVAAAQGAVQQAINENRETQRAMIYVISLPQEEREKLNLVRPKALTDMQR